MAVIGNLYTVLHFALFSGQMNEHIAVSNHSLALSFSYFNTFPLGVYCSALPPPHTHAHKAVLEVDETTLLLNKDTPHFHSCILKNLSSEFPTHPDLFTCNNFTAFLSLSWFSQTQVTCSTPLCVDLDFQEVL